MYGCVWNHEIGVFRKTMAAYFQTSPYFDYGNPKIGRNVGDLEVRMIELTSWKHDTFLSFRWLDHEIWKTNT